MTKRCSISPFGLSQFARSVVLGLLVVAPQVVILYLLACATGACCALIEYLYDPEVPWDRDFVVFVGVVVICAIYTTVILVNLKRIRKVVGNVARRIGLECTLAKEDSTEGANESSAGHSNSNQK